MKFNVHLTKLLQLLENSSGQTP